MKPMFQLALPKWLDLFSVQSTDPSRQADRIRFGERNVGLPIRAVILALLVYQLFFGKWSDLAGTREVLIDPIRVLFGLYVVGNAIGASVLIEMDRVSVRWVQWGVILLGLFDAMMLSGLMLVMGGFDSILFWVFPLLIVRVALSVPVPGPQLMLNLMVAACYLWSGMFDLSILQLETEFLSEAEMSEAQAVESFFLRLTVLGLLTVWCYAIEVLVERQRAAEEEAREFALRQQQLEATGRLAAEITHQLKNPLAIMNNAVYTLQKSLRNEGDPALQQIQILREEITRSDRILTDLMGYAQLAEGRVERLDIQEELESAISKVFPGGAHYQVKVDRDYAAVLPSLLMQRGHLSEVLVNVLHNAREAMQGQGQILVHTRYGDDYSVIVSIRDTGPGIPPEALGSVFEPYFTTKERGTGLGLAIVKHNTEIYGGTVRVESELGKGTEFILQFPARSLIRIRR